MFTAIRSFIFCFFLGLVFQARAFDVPRLSGPVVDHVGLLSTATQAQLSQILFQVHQNQGPQIQVLIVPSLQGLQIEEVAIKVFDEWKLGSKKEDNGVLFLIAPKERKLRIEVGRGLEGDIPDIRAKQIVMDIVSPLFKRGDFDAGVTQGVLAILHYAKVPIDGKVPAGPDSQNNQSDSHQGTSAKAYFFLIVLGIWILLFIFNPTLALAILFSGRFGSGGGGWTGGGGGGGWSGGGGGSAGGGASGDW